MRPLCAGSFVCRRPLDRSRLSTRRELRTALRGITRISAGTRVERQSSALKAVALNLRNVEERERRH
jgi:hypothetical protein